MTTIVPLSATLVWLALGGTHAQGPDAALRSQLLAQWQPGSGLYHLNIVLGRTEMADEGAAPAQEPGTVEEQIARFTTDLEKAEKRGVLLYGRAMLYVRAKQNRAAALDLLEAEIALGAELAADPSDADARLCYAQVCRLAGRLDDARNVLREGLERDPSQAAFLVALLPLLPAYEEELVGRTEAAVRDRLSRDPGDSAACANLFMTVLARMADQKVSNDIEALGAGGHYEELAARLNVLDALRAHQARHPDSAVARWWVGKAYVILGLQGVGSLTDLARVGKPAMAAFLRPAEQLLSDVLGSRAADLSSYMALLVVRAASADVAGVVQVADAAAEAFADDESVQLLRVGVLADIAGQVDRALEIAVPAAAKYDGGAWHATLAWLRYRKGEVDEAARIAQAVVDRKGEVEPAPLRRALLVLAAVAATRGDFEPAGRLIDDAASVMSGPDPAIDKAIVLALAGQTREARDLLIDVAMENPMNLPSRELLKLLPE